MTTVLEVSYDNEKRIRGWYSASEFPSGFRQADSALREAYDKATDFLSNNFSVDELASLGLGKKHSFEDVARILQRCKSKYEAKKTSKARRWLVQLSTKVIFYAPVLDVFAQIQPEYCSIIWGTMKFLFMSIMNQEEMVHRLSKACANIADVLPRTELSLILYPTQRMVEAVAHLYTKMMAFMLYAAKWYKQSKAGHVWSSISKPWSVAFKEHEEAIGEQARTVDDISSLAMKAEMRETRMQIMETRQQLKVSQQQIEHLSEYIKGEFRQLVDLALTNKTIQSQVQVDVSSSVKMISNVQLGQILSLSFMASLPTSGESLSHCETLQSRNWRFGKADIDTAKIQRWSAQAASHFLFPKCDFRNGSRDVLVAMIKTLRDAHQPVLWALRYPAFSEKPVTATDLLRMLVLQALQINPDALQKGVNPITVAHLREAGSEKDWLDILDRALVDVPRVYIILDSDLLNHAIAQNRYKATKFVESVPAAIRSEVKIVVPHTSVDLGYVSGHWETETWMQLQLGQKQRTGLEVAKKMRRRRGAMRARGRGRGRGQG